MVQNRLRIVHNVLLDTKVEWGAVHLLLMLGGFCRICKVCFRSINVQNNHLIMLIKATKYPLA